MVDVTNKFSFQSPTSKLHYLLQQVSDLCHTAKTLHKLPHVNVLSDSIRNHVVIPFRRYLYTTTNDATTICSVQTKPQYNQTITLILSLLKTCFPVLRGNLSVIPLSKVCDCFYAVLFTLHNESHAYHIINQIWQDLFNLLRDSLDLWLSQATIHDVHSQFFISNNDSNANVVEDRLPSFISVQVAQNILFAGNATKCTMFLNEETKQNQKLFSSTNITHSNDKYDVDAISSEPLLVALSIEAMSIRWKHKASCLLSNILPFDIIKHRIYQLRQYLLQGDSLFWRCFFEELERHRSLRFHAGLKDDDRTNITQTLNGIFHSLWIDQQTEKHFNLTNSNTPFEFQLTQNGELYPVFALSFAESQLLSSKASVYCDVFSITFHTRRVACYLRSVFPHLFFMERKFRLTLSSTTDRPLASWVKLRELRRRMAVFVDSFESYIQEKTLEPRFRELFAFFDEKPSDETIEQRDLGEKDRLESYFDKLLSAHDRLLNKILADCFVGEQQITKRVNGVFEACLELCDLIPTLNFKQGESFILPQDVNLIEKNFLRNVDLLVRILRERENEKPDFRVAAFLKRIECIGPVKVEPSGE